MKRLGFETGCNVFTLASQYIFMSVGIGHSARLLATQDGWYPFASEGEAQDDYYRPRFASSRSRFRAFDVGDKR